MAPWPVQERAAVALWLKDLAQPILVATTTARLLIVGQAPGVRAHDSGIPWNDSSGDRLRQWMEINRESFYHEDRIAIIPMGYCYPGRGKSGDLPPRRECAKLWLDQLLNHLPQVQLTSASRPIRSVPLPPIKTQVYADRDCADLAGLQANFCPCRTHPAGTMPGCAAIPGSKRKSYLACAAVSKARSSLSGEIYEG